MSRYRFPKSKKIYLKKNTKLRINRTIKGELNPKLWNNPFDTTVGEAIKNGYLSTSRGTLSVKVDLIDKINGSTDYFIQQDQKGIFIIVSWFHNQPAGAIRHNLKQKGSHENN